MGLDRLTPTHDLNARQIEALAIESGADRMEVVAFQHLPVFHTEHCVFCRFMSKGTSYLDCGRPCEKHEISLQDEQGRRHPVVADVGCRNTVFGAEAQHSATHLESWQRAGIRHFRIEFVHETAEQVTEICTIFKEVLSEKKRPSELQRLLSHCVPEGLTEGSLFVPKAEPLFKIL
jgi:putative protease